METVETRPGVDAWVSGISAAFATPTTAGPGLRSLGICVGWPHTHFAQCIKDVLVNAGHGPAAILYAV